MAKIKFGEGISFETELPEMGVISPLKEVVQPSIDDIVDAVLSVIPEHEDIVQVDILPLEDQLCTLSGRLNTLSDRIHSNVDSIGVVLNDISSLSESVQELAADESVGNNDQIEKSIITLSNRLVAKDVHINEVEAKLMSRIEKQKVINAVLCVGILISIIINLL